MKLSKKIRARIFDRYLGLTFDWRHTGLKRWPILLWMIFFSLCLVIGGSFVEVEIPKTKRITEEAAAVILLPSDEPMLNRLILRKTPLPARGPVWADPVTAGPAGELSVNLPPFDEGDTRLKPLPALSVSAVEDQFWNMWQMPDAHICAMIDASPAPEMICIPYLSFYTEGLDGEIHTLQAVRDFCGMGDHTGLRSEFFIVVNKWGVPAQVVLLNGSGCDEADVVAARFTRSLRWSPAAQPRSGTMTIEWKEVEGSL